MKYIKLFHYSSHSNLNSIDPSHYGSGAARGAECKYGKTGLNKAYFYIENNPEPCVRMGHCYEAYIPHEWKSLIYDRSLDPENFYEQVKADILALHRRPAYEYEIRDGIERKIFEAGFKGWRSSTSPQLPHALILFVSVSTHKPAGTYTVYNWNDIEIENTAPQPMTNLRSSQGCRLFQLARETQQLPSCERKIFSIML